MSEVVMKNNENLFLISLISFFTIFTGESWAFDCSGTYNYSVNAFQVTRQAGVSVAFPASWLYCTGASPEQDALRIQSVTLNQKLIDAGFTNSTLAVSPLGTYTYPFSAVLYSCVWYNTSCLAINGSGNTSSFTPTLKRSGPGKDLTMTSGETLMTIILYQRSNTTWAWPKTITYKLNGDITPPNYTCSVNNYDSTVNMPKVRAEDIRGRALGKIASSKKSVNLQLSCRPETMVSLQFDGGK